MSHSAREGHSESRTQSMGKKRSRTETQSQNRPRKRRRDSHGHQTRDPALTDNSFSALSHRIGASEASSQNGSIIHIPSQTTREAEQAKMSDAASPNLGRNRLLTGYARPQTSRQGSKSSGEISDATNTKSVGGDSSGSPIEISDDEMGESEGGMVINIDQDDPRVEVLSSDDASSQESGEVMSTPKDTSDTRDDSADLFTVDPTPSVPMKRLADLSQADLDNQLKYAFFHLDRDRVDLSRPVMCLGCVTEGHLYSDCKKTGTELFPSQKIDADTQVKLWVSCCVCASKSHLVGDCPQIRDGQAARWSLKTLKPEQVINLSLESGTKKLEKEAENRDMRPEGLRIRGRAGLHNTGGPQNGALSDDDDEPFLRKPITKRMTDGHVDSGHPKRYDRYDPPPGTQPHRGGGQWYTTDSFGRRRSRSPNDRTDSYRPRDDYDRSYAAPERDSWRPPPPAERREPQRPRIQSPPRNGRAPTATNGRPAGGPSANIRFSLPTRKGSNTWSQAGQSESSTPTSNDKTGGNARPKAKQRGGRRKKGGRGG